MSIRIKDENDIAWHKKSEQKQFKKDITNLIGYSIGLGKGERYKMKSTLQELIEYKYDRNEIDRFKLYVSTPLTLVELIKTKTPFIDMTGIDLQWTPQQILDYIVDIYYNHPMIPLKKS